MSASESGDGETPPGGHEAQDARAQEARGSRVGRPLRPADLALDFRGRTALRERTESHAAAPAAEPHAPLGNLAGAPHVEPHPVLPPSGWTPHDPSPPPSTAEPRSLHSVAQLSAALKARQERVPPSAQPPSLPLRSQATYSTASPSRRGEARSQFDAEEDRESAPSVAASSIPASASWLGAGGPMWQPTKDASLCASTQRPFDVSDRGGPLFPKLLPCGHAVAAGQIAGRSACPVPDCGRQLASGSVLDHAVVAAGLAGGSPGRRWLQAALELYRGRPLRLLSDSAHRQFAAGTHATLLAHEDHDVVVKRYAVRGVQSQPQQQQQQQQLIALWDVLLSTVLSQIAPECVPRVTAWNYDGHAVQLAQQRFSGSLREFVGRERERASASSPAQWSSCVLIVAFNVASVLSQLHALSLAAPAVDSEHGPVRGVVHGCVNPDNVLVDDATLDATLCGLSHCTLLLSGDAVLQPPEPADDSPFAPLEAVTDQSDHALTEQADVWGLAVTVLFMASGEPPYAGLRVTQRIRAQMAGRPPYGPVPPVHPRLDSLLERCLSRNPRDRPSLANVLDAMSGLVAGPLHAQLRRANAANRDVVGHLEAKARALEADLDKEQARVAELEKRLQQQAALPLGIDLDLKSLCDYSREHAQAARQAGRAGAGDGEDGDASGAVIDLSRRHVHAASASADASAQAVSRVFNLGCSLRGGVLHLQALDVLRVHCAKLEGVEMQGHNAGSHTPVIVLRGPRMRVEDICVSRCSVRVLGAGARLLRCKVSDCEALPAIHVAGDADGPSGEDVPVTLHKCEAADSFIGLLVSGCPHLVLVTKCRFHQSREHNVRIGKHGSVPSDVQLTDTYCERAGRSGVFVESLCKLVAERCIMRHNAHYGVQTMPKAEVTLKLCDVQSNVRGELSGHNIRNLSVAD